MGVDYKKELQLLIANGIWEVTPLPKGPQGCEVQIGLSHEKRCQWRSNMFKVSLVAKGCLQIKGVNFGKTFVLVAKFNTTQIILSFQVNMNLEIHQMDIKTSFLNGKLDVKIYIKQPSKMARSTLYTM